MEKLIKKVYVSHSPATKKHAKDTYWYKSIKDQKTIGGNIVAHAFGKTKEEAENMAIRIVAAYNEMFDK